MGSASDTEGTLVRDGRINRDMWWGDWAFLGGIAVLVVAGTLFLLLSRR